MKNNNFEIKKTTKKRTKIAKKQQSKLTHDKHGKKTPSRYWPTDQEHHKGPKI